ncbi:hypothetical protein GH714_037349 [Hevea brasiliensis]|uniref:Uncharacterized protein n=1 Tax=Hevea brasiliensis TaxID=3981 RepID=A0A6A6KNT3_HEVBR|nr:hypothetical protein GH714_037349 [Hevea brasiliensis]
MEEAKKPETHMTSAAAFVEGGIQDSCEDACSICLEEFSESDPSTVYGASTASHSLSPNQDREGPSEFQSFSESLKSRLNAMSMRHLYLDTKNLFQEVQEGGRRGCSFSSSSMSDLGSEVRREVNAGIACVSCVMDRLETRDNSRANQVSVPTHSTDYSVAESSNQNNANTHRHSRINESNTPASCAASSAST